MLERARAGGVDIAIIDTLGKIEQASVEAAKFSTLALIPVRATAFDLNALKELRNLLAIAGNPPCLTLLSTPLRRKDVATKTPKR